MDEIAVGLHIFLVVLVIGTLWRLGAYHLIASGNPQLERLGKGMTFQY